MLHVQVHFAAEPISRASGAIISPSKLNQLGFIAIRFMPDDAEIGICANHNLFWNVQKPSAWRWWQETGEDSAGGID